ncbi:MAG: creatininase family protein [Candidatus Aenigmarchaeota archaeon]|nr:creatininase family protein [Candidatus Aenigmarchaeota archaeon]
MDKLTKWENLRISEIEDIDKNKIIVIPIGSVEAHGNHLTINTDNITAQFLASELCKETNSILGTPVTIGNSSKLVDFPGTLTVRSEILKEYLKDVIVSYKRSGFNKILILNGHRGNDNWIKQTLDELNDKNVKSVSYASLLELDDSYKSRHSGRLETEVVMTSKMSFVDMDKAEDHYIEDDKLVKNKYPKDLMPECIDGFPTKANVKDGREVVKQLLVKLKEALGKF